MVGTRLVYHGRGTTLVFHPIEIEVYEDWPAYNANCQTEMTQHYGEIIEQQKADGIVEVAD